MQYKTRWIVLALALVVVVVAGAGGWFFFRIPPTCCAPLPVPPPTPSAQSEAAPAAAAPAAAAPAAGQSGTGTAPAQPAGNTGAKTAEAEKPAETKPTPFELKRLDLDTSKDAAAACLSFSEALIEGPAAHYEDYVSVPGHPEVALQASGPRLCISGLAFGKAYSIELRAGLPASSGAKLAAGDSLPLTFADKAAVVRFAASAQFILPRTGNAGVPITTVNLDEVALRVYRVSDRALFQKLDLQAVINSYQVEQIESETGALVWSGKMAVHGQRNETAVTAFPIREVVKPWKPGAYVVLATDKFRPTDEERWQENIAAQLVYDTDLGLTVFRGTEGLDVYVRSIETAKPVAAAKLALIAHNNDELGNAVSDASGHARLAPGLLRGKGATEPLMIMAYGPTDDTGKAGDAIGDFNRILLTTAAFDLSDRGVSGRPAPGALDVYIASDRGIYRPGETVNLVALVRDAAANAVEKTPVSLVIRRPDGVEQSRLLLADGGDGGTHVPLRLSATAQRGLWTAAAVLDGKSAIGKAEFMVDDFVPQRLKLTLASAAAALAAKAPISIAAEVMFLYGAPAAGLSGEAELQIAAEPTPFANYRNFSFGRAEEKPDFKPIALEIADTDAGGKTTVSGEPLELPQTSLPLKADITVGIHEPGGRVTKDVLTLPVRTRTLFIGMRPLFQDAVPIGDDARFELVALDADGKALARPGLSYELVRQDVHWQWYESGHGWNYEAIRKESPVSTGSVDANAERPTALTLPLAGWGRYRLTIKDAESGAVTSALFLSGWWDAGPDAADTPDKVSVVAEREKYRAGETAHLTIKPPFEADVLLTVAGNHIFESREVHVPAAGGSVDIPVSESWGSGAYVMATAYRPLRAGKAREPVRAVGVSWVALDLSARTLAVKLEVAERLRPRTSVTVPLSIDGLAAGTSAHLTLAAVDEGILQLTHFKTPSPADYYYGKRQLGVAMRDDYGRLLDEREAPAGAIHVGGDAGLGGASLPVVPTKTVSLFSGLVESDKDGHAQITFEVPDFQGQLRFMALAYNKTQVGSGEAKAAVRDAVVAEATLPRFLAPGDKSRLSLLLHNVEGAAGDYKLSLTASGAAGLESAVERTVTLASGERQLLALPIMGKEAGIGSYTVKLAGPGGFAVEHTWDIAVRPPQVPATQDLSVQLQPGRALHLDGSLTADMVPGSAHVGVTVESWRGFNVPALLGALDRYPYGCLEQTTSRAFPLLYFNEVALAGNAKADQAIPERVQKAIGRVLDMQRAGGDFGLWGSEDSAYPWLSVFALDFLFEAKKAGYVVPQSAMLRGIDWLTGLTHNREVSFADADGDVYWKDKWHRARIRAYAFYLLAKMNLANLGDLRYFHDNELGAVDSALGYGQVAAALAMAGDRTRAANAFRLAREALPRNVTHDYYGSRLRDLAALTAASAEAGESGLLKTLLDDLPRIQYRAGWTTTQEDAWMLIAAHALLKNAGAVSTEIDGKPAATSEGPLALAPGDAELAKGIDIRNAGDKPIWGLLSIEGVPLLPAPAEARGFAIQRRFQDLQGNAIDPATFKQNDRFVITLSGNATDKFEHDAVVVNLLPAGWEIESIVKPSEGDNAEFAWLKVTTVRMKEARDDRFVAAVTFGRQSRWALEDNKFQAAFIVRATIPGSYALPAASIEDMYRPALHARTAMGTTVVTAKE
ncbi:MAG: alpha-2-macroglobulin [Alphaproteobacteria bacterium]